NIRVSNIYQECLKLLNYPQILTITNLLQVLSEFIEPPRESYITVALEQLRDLKLADDKITEFGKIVADLQMDPRIAIAGYMGRKLRCSNEVLIILATIEAAKNNLSELFRLPEIDEDSKEKKYL